MAENLDINVNVGANSDQAIKEIDKISTYINNLNKSTERGLKIRGFEQSGESKTLKYYQQWIKYAGQLQLVLAKVNKETGKIKNIEVTTPTNKQIKTRFGQVDTSGTPLPEPKNLAKQSEKSLKPANKFLKTFQRIGFYRIARNVFRIVEQTFTQGITSLAKFDKEANKTMSSLSSSFEKIKGSVALAFMPILETLAPIFEQIANTVGQVASGISRASASAKGLTKYTKINEEYMKDFSEDTKSSLLSFDKFETLSGGDDQKSPFVEAEIDPDEQLSTTESIGISIFNIFNKVLEIVGKVWKLVKPIIGVLFEIIEPILDIINLLLDVLRPLIEWIFDSIGSVIDQIKGSFKIISGLLKLLTGDFKGAWDSIKGGFHDLLQGCINGFIDMINLAIKILLTPLSWIIKILGKIFGFDFDLTEAAKIPHVTLPAFADGGMVEKGSLFIAGEAGAELVTNTSTGQTGVTNIEQFKEAMVQALYEASDVFYNGEGTVVLNLDGAEVARSRRFKSELNRTNSGLNLV